MLQIGRIVYRTISGILIGHYLEIPSQAMRYGCYYRVFLIDLCILVIGNLQAPYLALSILEHTGR